MGDPGFGKGREHRAAKDRRQDEGKPREVADFAVER
jgi:hypothetical protein